LSSSRNRAPAPYAGPSARRALAWLVAALVVQGTLMHVVVIHGAEPSLVLVVVVWYATRTDIGRATIYGILAGVGEDLIAFDAGGTWTIATALTALLASLPARRFFEDSMPFFMIVTALATLVRELVFWSLKKIEGFPTGLGTPHFHAALVQAALNAALAALAMFVARRFERREATRWRR
jgi:rod shape-determining protein MreD